MPFIQINILEGRSPEKKETIDSGSNRFSFRGFRSTRAKCSGYDSRIASQNIGALLENL